jgi:hypothetical protein
MRWAGADLEAEVVVVKVPVVDDLAVELGRVLQEDRRVCQAVREWLDGSAAHLLDDFENVVCDEGSLLPILGVCVVVHDLHSAACNNGK